MQLKPFLVPDLPEITELRHTNKIDLIYSCTVKKFKAEIYFHKFTFLLLRRSL